MKKFDIAITMHLSVYGDTEEEVVECINGAIANEEITLIPEYDEPSYKIKATEKYEVKKTIGSFEMAILSGRFSAAMANVDVPNDDAYNDAFNDYIRNTEDCEEGETGAIRKVWLKDKPVIREGHIYNE